MIKPLELKNDLQAQIGKRTLEQVHFNEKVIVKSESCLTDKSSLTIPTTDLIYLSPYVA